MLNEVKHLKLKPILLALIVPLLVAVVLLGGDFLMDRVQISFPSSTLVNPGFEADEAGADLSGWKTSGPAEAFGIEFEAHSGKFRLTQRGVAAPVETWQTLEGLKNGWYTLSAWVRSSGDQKAGYIRLKDCGSTEQRASVPVAPVDQWLQIVISSQVTNGKCTIGLGSEAGQKAWVSFDDLEFAPGRAALSIMGADVSSLKKSEDKGGVYTYEDGTPGDALQILKDHGLNAIRLRVWVDPADGYHDQAELLVMARRAKELGIQVLVDFHYSDTWADPGKQYKPAAWEKLDFEGLKKALYDHTFEVCSSLAAQGTPPYMVQLGNEINAGMLWPDGHSDRWDNLAALLKEGYRAVKDCSPSTLVMLHLAEGGKNEQARWWFDNAVQRGVPFDLIGVSYYAYWHGNLAELQNNLNDITLRYGKDVIVVETAHAFTRENNDHEPNIITNQILRGYPFSQEGQEKMLADVMAIVRAVPDGRGLGVFYWDATWTAVEGNGWSPANPKSGNAWENQALFGYQNQALPAMRLFGIP
jgi:arabinogalactan endo-1,4-beta-galactosidase